MGDNMSGFIWSLVAIVALVIGYIAIFGKDDDVD